MAQSLNVRETCEALLQQTKTVLMATTNAEGKPLASYAPFYRNEEGDFYVYTSQLSAHTSNLLRETTVSVMVITDEQSVEQIFARTRLSLECEVMAVDPESGDHTAILDAYQHRHGKTVELLRSLPDFLLFRLRPVAGTVVLGFGQAFRISSRHLESFEHIKSA